jgi:hypothetical protein
MMVVAKWKVELRPSRRGMQRVSRPDERSSIPSEGMADAFVFGSMDNDSHPIAVLYANYCVRDTKSSDFVYHNVIMWRVAGGFHSAGAARCAAQHRHWIKRTPFQRVAARATGIVPR